MEKEMLKEMNDCFGCKCRKPKLEYKMVVRKSGKIFTKKWRVICTTCGAAGPKENTNKIAIDSWNELHKVKIQGRGLTKKQKEKLGEWIKGLADAAKDGISHVGLCNSNSRESEARSLVINAHSNLLKFMEEI